MRRGGIPGPESRTGLVRPAMTEAEFERRQQRPGRGQRRHAAEPTRPPRPSQPEAEPERRRAAAGAARAPRGPRQGGKPRRVQRMFALEEDLDKKLWLYAIHVGKDRSEVVNDLLRPWSPRWSSTTPATAAPPPALRPRPRYDSRVGGMRWLGRFEVTPQCSVRPSPPTRPAASPPPEAGSAAGQASRFWSRAPPAMFVKPAEFDARS